MKISNLSFKIFESIMKKKIIFRLIAISFPVIIILILEVILRIAGYGEDYQLFHRVPIQNKPDYLIMNEHIAKKYFNDNDFRSDNQSVLQRRVFFKNVKA